MVALASEDSLRLQVLLASKPQAIRIDESRLIVYGLSEQGEAKVVLHPTGQPEFYLKAVRELISWKILGSPGGYPVYIRRWTRMGQMRDQSLERLLLLGEPEAVVAAVCSPGLTDELARRAWWAMEDAENARRMLENPAIVSGRMGRVLAQFLLDFLPFETETEKMAASVRLILQPGLLEEDQVLALWQKAKRRPAYQLGFLQSRPQSLPEQGKARPGFEQLRADLIPLLQQGNAYAQLLLQIWSGPGQTYLQLLAKVLSNPPTQGVIQETLDTVRNHLQALRPQGDPDQTWEALLASAEIFESPDRLPPEAAACLRVRPDLKAALKALWVLSGLGYGVLRPHLRDSTATGSLMRRKLKPVLIPILAQIECLSEKPLNTQVRFRLGRRP